MNYEQAQAKLSGYIKRKEVETLNISDFPKRTLKFKITGEKEPFTYSGENVNKLALYFFKQVHKKDSHPELLRRCPECNLRAAIHYYDGIIQCHTCDYKTDLTTWNRENPHLKFDVD